MKHKNATSEGFKMSETSNVIRFEHDGPAGKGLDRWPAISPANIVSGTPVQNGHTYHENAGAGYTAGVWDCTPYTDRAGPYGVDEFMLLLEGTVVMIMPDGSKVAVTAPQSFVLPKGLQCQWKQPNYVRKFFMILDGPVPEGASNPSLGRVVLPDHSALELPDDAVEVERVDFVNAAGNMQVRLRQCAASTVPEHSAGANHLIHVLEGALLLTQGSTIQRFAAGDTAYVTQGSRVGWQTEAGTRLLQASCRL
jgi:uncharacterized cupin superfamily protein